MPSSFVAGSAAGSRRSTGGSTTSCCSPIDSAFSRTTTTSSGLVKGKCRSRLTSSIDYDADGLLDLFSSCKQSTPKLYRALGSGGYGSRSKALARVDSEGTYYRWVDLRGDRRPELVVLGKEKAVVLQSKGLRRWREVQRVEALNGSQARLQRRNR